MSKSHILVIVTGMPGTGKSYCAAKLKEACPELELFAFDALKERRYDELGFDNLEEKTKINNDCLEEFYEILGTKMKEEKQLLIEYPFRETHIKRFRELIDTYGYAAVTVYLYGDKRTIYNRGISRDNRGKRHPGHLYNRYHKAEAVDTSTKLPSARLSYEEFLKMMSERNYDISIGTEIKIDVTDLGKISYEEAIQVIRKMENS